MKRKILNPAVLTLTLSSVFLPFIHTPAASANTPTNSSECKAVHIVAGPGTGGSNNDDNTEYLGDPVTEHLLKKYPNDVNGYTIPYPASAGAAGSFAAPKSKNGTTFGDSRLLGDEKGLKHIEEYRNNCPDSMIMLVGYSQGASVAGDIAVAIANGALKNTTSDNILSVFLMADPGRSGNSPYTGPAKDNKTWFELPEGLKYQRNGELSTPTQDEYIGWTGQRSLPFTGLEGRVISLCSNDDLACSAAAGGVLRQVADMSDKNITPNEAYRNGSTGLQLLQKNPQVFTDVLGASKFGEILASGGSLKEATANGREYLIKSNIDDEYKYFLNNFFVELEQVMDILHQDNAFGKNVTDAQILSAFLKNGTPELIDKLPITPEQKLGVQAVATMITSNTPDLPADVKKRMEPVINRAITFPKEHASYFNEHKFNGQTSITWAKELADQGVANYLAGNSFVFKADPNNSGELEFAEENRKDDGLQGLVDGTERPVLPNGELKSADEISDDNTATQPKRTNTPKPTQQNPIVSETTNSKEKDKSSRTRTRSSEESSTETPSSKEDPTTTEETTTPTTSSTPATASFTGNDAMVDTGGEVVPNFADKVKAIF